jgi:hypothetical protein
MRFELTPEQAKQVAPLLADAASMPELSPGVVFGQVLRGSFPDHERISLHVALIDAKTARRIQTVLALAERDKGKAKAK